MERTNIVFCFRVSRFDLSRYLARTMPAGHNCPPHPCFKSCWSWSGGVRSPSKSIELVVAARWFGDWMNSSPMVRGLGSSSSDEWLGEVIVECGLRMVVVVDS